MNRRAKNLVRMVEDSRNAHGKDLFESVVLTYEENHFCLRPFSIQPILFFVSGAAETLGKKRFFTEKGARYAADQAVMHYHDEMVEARADYSNHPLTPRKSTA
jgi:hypothetical protein